MNERLKVGDWVKIIKIPQDLTNSPGLKTRRVFQQALGGTFRVEGFGPYGHIELTVRENRPSSRKYESDTICIEPEFVVRVRRKRKSKGR